MPTRKQTDRPLAVMAKQFLHHAERYFDLQERRTIAASILGLSKTPDVMLKLDRAVRNYNKALSNRRHAMLALRESLCAKLEQGGFNSADLLSFLYCVDRGGGPSTAIVVWSKLNPQLQRIIILRAMEPVPDQGNIKRKPGEWLYAAAVLVNKHPEWSDRKIAEEVRVHRATLSKNQIYQEAAKIARDQGISVSRGYRTKDGDIEAIDS